MGWAAPWHATTRRPNRRLHIDRQSRSCSGLSASSAGEGRAVHTYVARAGGTSASPDSQNRLRPHCSGLASTTLGGNLVIGPRRSRTAGAGDKLRLHLMAHWLSGQASNWPSSFPDRSDGVP